MPFSCNAIFGHLCAYLAFENQNSVDYVTEKLWGAFASGTIPIYYGAPNIAKLIPIDSAVLIQSFKSVEEAAVEIVKMLTVPSVYAKYHAWRYQPLPLHFVRRWNLTHTHSECRLCQLVHRRVHTQAVSASTVAH